MLLSCTPSRTAVPEPGAPARNAGSGFAAPDNPALVYEGAWFAEIDGKGARLLRHSAECREDPDCIPEWLRKYGIHEQHAGATIRFSTDARRVSALFEESPVTPVEFRRFPYLRIGLEVDGTWRGQFDPAERRTEGTNAIELPSAGEGFHDYEIVLPHQLALIFRGLELEGGSLRKPPEDRRPVLVAIGDSQSHGEGQLSAADGYLWKLAKAKGWRLVNLAVGGTTIEPKMARMNLPGRRCDVVVVEWGYNDWWSALFSLEAQTARFRETLAAVRELQPGAKIVVVSPFATETARGDSSAADGLARDGSSIADWRAMMKAAVDERAEAGDRNVLYVGGDEISDVDDIDHRDGVHLTPEGAARVAERLAARL